MAKWDQWLKNDTNKKEKFHSKFNDEYSDRPQRDRKRRKPRSGRPTHEDYPFD
ncbi:hypothetical protein [Enterovibrio coralii]|uniref:hypothetical protein n=1 Tax=Enterovibrio coralii TaxID=294935 RepID=UPI000A6C3D71|nr:hypothetical protein [Enterovibrio coralii]